MRTTPALAPDGLCSLIESLGTAGFARELVHSVGSMLEAADGAVYAFGDRRGTRVVAAWGNGAPTLARRTHAYAERFADRDPARRLPSTGEVITTCIDTAELPDPGHRALLEETGFECRVVSVFPSPDGGWYSLNVPRPFGRGIPDAVLDRFARAVPVYASLIARHLHAGSIPSRLAALCPALTPRELAVCDAMLRGRSAAEAAAALGIRASSAQTYRKRAYAKLSVASLPELFQRLL
jgi:DNA-binding CsgD family transcriptional regulator